MEKKIVKRITIDTLVVLPNAIVDKINTLFKTERIKSHVYSFIYQLANASMEEHNTIIGKVPFPTVRFREHFGSTYHNQWLNDLLSSQIVMKNDYYSKEKRICLNYWINPLYNCYDSKQENLQYVEIPIKLSIKKMSKLELLFQKQVTNDFKNLIFDELKLKEIVKKHIANFSLSDYFICDSIAEKKIKVTYADLNGCVHTNFMKREDVLLNSKKHGQDLIYDKKNNKYYSYKLEDFILLKKSAVERYYLESISKLVRKKVYARRNKTNFRVDSNMTNCPSILIEQIMSDNNLCQIDMSNAQFAIFANNIATKNLMNPSLHTVPIKKRKYLELRKNDLEKELELLLKSDNFKEFSDLVSNGELYNAVKEKLVLENRDIAKKIMFQILFSSERLKNDLKDKIVTMFPNVISYIDNYKKCFGYKNFSIGLQKRESEIFIDDIYTKLKKANIATITRHDSIIVSFENEIKALKIINHCFKSIKFNCILEREGRISNRFFELSKIKQQELDLGIDRIIQIVRPIKSDLDEIGKNLLDDEKVLKKTRAPKKSPLNYNR